MPWPEPRRRLLAPVSSVTRTNSGERRCRHFPLSGWWQVADQLLEGFVLHHDKIKVCCFAFHFYVPADKNIGLSGMACRFQGGVGLCLQ